MKPPAEAGGWVAQQFSLARVNSAQSNRQLPLAAIGTRWQSGIWARLVNLAPGPRLLLAEDAGGVPDAVGATFHVVAVVSMMRADRAPVA